MQRLTVTPCGISVFLNGTRFEHIKFLKKNINKSYSEYTPGELSVFEQICKVRHDKLAHAELYEASTMSIELNGFIKFYDDNLDEATKDVHYLLHTDTYQGQRAAELIQSWGACNNIKFQPVLIKEINLFDVDEFQLGVNNLVKWCAEKLPAFRSQDYKIIFNLSGGFKSLQYYMQILGMFYADEIFSTFENSDELLKIPMTKISFLPNVKEVVRKNVDVFQRMQNKKISRSECLDIPENLLNIVNNNCSVSVFGQIAFEEVKREI
ncbi:MAG: hypothetical protein IJS40_00455 [Synergistaceae bacterium]|nr:hypothetical protein [Synergistaceae bacterium]